MHRRSERRRRATSLDELTTGAESSGRLAIEILADRRPTVAEQAEQRELAELITNIVLTIEPRARKVWTMRFLERRTPAEVMAELSITRRHYARLVARANTAINRKLLAHLAGDWCPGYASTFATLAAGLATPAQAQEAHAHLAACPSCHATYETFTRLHPRQPLK